MLVYSSIATRGLRHRRVLRLTIDPLVCSVRCMHSLLLCRTVNHRAEFVSASVLFARVAYFLFVEWGYRFFVVDITRIRRSSGWLMGYAISKRWALPLAAGTVCLRGVVWRLLFSSFVSKLCCTVSSLCLRVEISAPILVGCSNLEHVFSVTLLMCLH